LFLNFFDKNIINLIVKSVIRAVKKQGRLPYNKNIRVKFCEDCIFESSEVGEITMKCDFLGKVVTSEHGDYLYFGAIQALILPQHIYESEQQRVNFLTFINGKVSAT